MADYTMYGSDMSYFSGKARAYLRWKGIDFTEVQPTPDVMQNIIIANVGWPVIPVLKTPDDRIVQDTADIIAEIENVQPSPAVMPESGVQRFVSYLIQLFADEWLLIPAMHYRWHYNEDWIFGEFGKFAAPNGSPEEQYQAGKMAGQRFQAFVPLLGVSEATISGIEASYEALLSDFSAHLEHHSYVLGDRPSFADFAMTGALYAHQYRDPYTGDLMKRIAPRVADWVERMIAGEPGTGDLLGDDAIPDSLLPLLQRQMAEQLPVLEATNAMLGQWAKDAQPGEELPRGFDMTPFTTGGASGVCMARTFSLLRLQSALDALDALTPEDRSKADALLDRVGGGALKTLKLEARLERRYYLLCLA